MVALQTVEPTAFPHLDGKHISGSIPPHNIVAISEAVKAGTLNGKVNSALDELEKWCQPSPDQFQFQTLGSAMGLNPHQLDGTWETPDQEGGAKKGGESKSGDAATESIVTQAAAPDNACSLAPAGGPPHQLPPIVDSTAVDTAGSSAGANKNEIEQPANNNPNEVNNKEPGSAGTETIEPAVGEGAVVDAAAGGGPAGTMTGGPGSPKPPKSCCAVM